MCRGLFRMRIGLFSKSVSSLEIVYGSLFKRCWCVYNMKIVSSQGCAATHTATHTATHAATYTATHTAM